MSLSIFSYFGQFRFQLRFPVCGDSTVSRLLRADFTGIPYCQLVLL